MCTRTHMYVCIYIYFGIKQIMHSQIQIGHSTASPFLTEDVLIPVNLRICYLPLVSDTWCLWRGYIGSATT